MLKITEKDRKMLIVLAVFLVAIGYYELIFSPLYNMSMASDSKLLKGRKQLLVLKTKLAGLANYKRKLDDLNEIICIAEKSNLMPDVDVPLDTKIKAIMTAADISYVKIRSIKPMNYIEEGTKGEPVIIRDKFFSIEGTSTIEDFLKFIRNLWGTRLDTINLASVDTEGNELRYFIKIEFLDKSDLKIDKVNDENIAKFSDFTIKNNPFTIIKPPPPPVKIQKMPDKPPEPPKIVHTITNFELIGIAEFNNEKMAIVNDREKNRVIYLLKGDSFRGAVVKYIKANEIAFYFDDNKQTITEKLKDSTLKLMSSSKQTPQDKDKRKGHLGVMVETFTQDIANKYHLEFNPGLFVVSPGRHRNIFNKNDVIIEINEQPVPNFEAALRVMNNIYAGDKIKILLKREGKSMNLSYNAD